MENFLDATEGSAAVLIQKNFRSPLYSFPARSYPLQSKKERAIKEGLRGENSPTSCPINFSRRDFWANLLHQLTFGDLPGIMIPGKAPLGIWCEKGRWTMANVAKYTKGTMGHMMKHYERGKDENGDIVKFKNEQIDPTRSHLNYNLAPHQQNQLDFIHKRLSEVHCLKRKDVNVMVSWVISAPKDLPAEHTREFFERSYQFLEKKYGKENVISAYVHMDETNPHMHFAFVPVVYDKKKEREKVSAKDVVTLAELKQFHKDFQREMNRFEDDYGGTFECNVLNGATAGGNKSIEQMKAEFLAEVNDRAIDRINELTDQIGDMESTLETLSERQKRLLGQISHAERIKTRLEGDIRQLEGAIKQRVTSDDYLVERFLSVENVRATFEKFVRDTEQTRNTYLESVSLTMDSYFGDIDRERESSPSAPKKHMGDKGKNSPTRD